MKLDMNRQALKKGARKNIVVASSFDGILEASKQYKIQLLVYKLNQNSKKSCADNYYLNLDDFYANEKLR